MSLEIGGFIQGYTTRDILASPNESHICRLCGGYDKDWLGYSRMRVSDGSGEIDLVKCQICNGTAVEPKSLVWIGTWYKPWTWFCFEKRWT